MKNLSHLFAAICCSLLLVNRPAYAQEEEQSHTNTVIFEGETEAKIDSRFVELVEAHKAIDKVLSLKNLRHFKGDDFHDLVGITGYASWSDTSATTSKNNRGVVGALIGGSVGAIIGLVGYEIAENKLCSDNFFDECDISPSRGASMVILGTIGAVVGLVVGRAIGSTRAHSLYEQGHQSSWKLRIGVLPHSHQKPTLAVSYRF